MKFQVKLQFDKQERKTVERGFHFWGTRAEDLVDGEQARVIFSKTVNRLLEGQPHMQDLETGIALLERIRKNVKREIETLEPMKKAPKATGPHAFIMNPAEAVATIECCRATQLKDVEEADQLLFAALAKLRPVTAVADLILPDERHLSDGDEEEV